MDGDSGPERVDWNLPRPSSVGSRRWRAHGAHGPESTAMPHRGVRPWLSATGRAELRVMSAETTDPQGEQKPVRLDGSRGEGGGQILRTALTLSLLTGRPFRMSRIRANRDKPGLRPQHKAAVDSAAKLGHAQVIGASVGSRELTFRPDPYEPRDLTIDIGTAGSTGLVLQTLHLPLAMRASSPVRVVLAGGTFNPKAPAYLFLESTWRAYLAAFGMPMALTMPAAGFYPRGGGQLEAWIEPASPRAWVRTDRGPLRRIRGIAGVANLRDDIARRMRDRVIRRLEAQGLPDRVEIDIDLVQWSSPGQGAAIGLTAEYDGATIPATFVGLGERGKPSEAVADEAVDQWLAFEAVPGAAVDPHSADQILLPLAFAAGRSEFTVSEVTEHLRTNADTIAAFLDRTITIEEPEAEGRPGRVIIAQ
ncbi:MAG: RNA 3'-terminal phosphate cyclase [Isosphaeraceae bacterium]